MIFCWLDLEFVFGALDLDLENCMMFFWLDWEFVFGAMYFEFLTPLVDMAWHP